MQIFSFLVSWSSVFDSLYFSNNSMWELSRTYGSTSVYLVQSRGVRYWYGVLPYLRTYITMGLFLVPMLSPRAPHAPVSQGLKVSVITRSSPDNVPPSRRRVPCTSVHTYCSTSRTRGKLAWPNSRCQQDRQWQCHRRPASQAFISEPNPRRPSFADVRR